MPIKAASGTITAMDFFIVYLERIDRGVVGNRLRHALDPRSLPADKNYLSVAAARVEFCQSC
jgi:hypothetical protein